MATLKQKAVKKDLLENVGKPIGRAMLDAGYSPATAKNPDHLTESKGWAEIMEEALPDSLLSQVHMEGLTANKQLSAKIIMLGGKGDANSQTDDFIEVPDYPTRHKYLETAYKIKGRMVDKAQIDGKLEVILTRE